MRRTDARAAALAAVLLAGLIVLAGPADAQVTDTLSGFSMDSDQPVKIEADVLEVRDTDRVAEFSGNVVVTQGDTTMRTSKLRVFYTGDATEAASGGSNAANNISRLEASGKVVVVTGDQKATGEWANFEMASQQITMGGGVVLSQGDNVLRGTSLVVDLQSGRSRLESDGRVQGLFKPGGMGQKQERSQPGAQ